MTAEEKELNTEMHKICGWNYDSSRRSWHRNGFWTVGPNRYTSGENFQELLGKCGESRTIQIYLGHNALWHVEHEDVMPDEPVVDISAEAETLPLALVKFARKLFEK